MKIAILPRRSRRNTLLVGAACTLLMALATPQAAADPVTSGKNYYAINQNDKGVTFQAYVSWDYAIFTNDFHSAGTALNFRKTDTGYVIKSTAADWGEYNTWCADGATVKLHRESDCASHWEIVGAKDGGYLIRKWGTEEYVTQLASTHGGWLSLNEVIMPGLREFSRFTFKPA